jgi:Tfp pilus assembly protein PilO
MKDIFSAFGEKERKRVRLLLLFLALSLVFLFLLSFRERRSYHQLAGQLEAQKNEFESLDKKRAAAALEGARWEKAAKDLNDLKIRYFYQEQGGVNALRLDLRLLFGKGGIAARSLKFDYADLEREKVRKVGVTFNFTGSYPVLKQFLETIEQFPKFLYLERLDFMRITGGGSSLELKVTLAGYYEYF